MLKNIFSVGAMTLLSRFFGLVRDIVQANVVGGGSLGDAFAIANRIPNHFRAIFAEGAFNAAFVPTFNRIAGEEGRERALVFADRMFMLLLLVQLVLLAVALLFMPFVVGFLAPGLKGGDARLPLAIELTRITFPYLAFISLTVLISGVLNAIGRFAAAAATAVLLNLSMIAALLVADRFPTAGHALATGVVVSGLLQFLLVAFDAWRSGVMMELKLPRLDAHARRFWRAFGPAVVGAAGFQIAVFADTIIASFLPAGRINALYYADHVNQLPVGVIGIAVGTVLLADMSRRIGLGDETGAKQVQLRAVELTLLGSLPFVAAFLILPDVIIRALFLHGRTTFEDTVYASELLQGYGYGLIAFVLLRNMSVTFHARSDTRTPVIAMFCGVIINIALKLLLIGRLEHVALAIGTSAGAWVNIGMLVYLGRRKGYLALDDDARFTLPRLALAFAVLALVLSGLEMALYMVKAPWAANDHIRLALYILTTGLVYGTVLLVLFGKTHLLKLMAMRRGVSTTG